MKIIDENIVIFEDVMDTKTILEKTMDNNSKINWSKPKIGSHSNEIKTDEDIRKCRVSYIDPEENFIDCWQEVLHCFDKYSKIYEDLFNLPRCVFEVPHFLHYSNKDKSLYRKHVDQSEPLKRIYSAILYLNDVEEGGETYFDWFDVTIKPRNGTLLFFPSTEPYSHEAREPISEDKFVIATWFKPQNLADDDQKIIYL